MLFPAPELQHFLQRKEMLLKQFFSRRFQSNITLLSFFRRLKLNITNFIPEIKATSMQTIKSMKSYWSNLKPHFD